MTRGAGRSQGFRPDSALRPGKVVVPFGERTTICPPCRKHMHGSCWTHQAAIGMLPGPTAEAAACDCGCHVPLDDPLLVGDAVEDMAAHGTLVEWVRTHQAWLAGSGPGHFKQTCRRCSAIDAVGDKQVELW